MPKGNPTGYDFRMPTGTKGNRDLPPNRTSNHQGMPSSHGDGGVSAGKYIGKTKGNRDLPPNRTAGAPATGKAGTFIAGRRQPY